MANGHGGRREGVQGKAYANRSDLNRSAARVPSTPRVAPAGNQSEYGAQAEQIRSLRALPFDRPTDRTDEPLTAGIDLGPGPGAPPRPLSENVAFAPQMVVALEALAALPDASDATRNLVRRIRSQA